tara:strand:+ start:292 stop:1020 length:729 start_codon:yes stop_codon:yes gene_type:complete
VSDYLSDEEQAARLRSWWVANGINVLVIGVVALGGFLGYRYYDDSAQQSAEASTAALAEYQEADTAEREALGDELAEQFPGTAQHALVLLRRAALAAEESRLGDAAQALEAAIEVADDALIADLARIRLARVLQGLNRSEDALATLVKVKNVGYRSWALEVRGDIHMAANNVAQAHESYTAALEALAEGEERPILTVKLDTTAPSNGEYVPLQDTLNDALRKAEKALSEAAANDVDMESANE